MNLDWLGPAQRDEVNAAPCPSTSQGRPSPQTWSSRRSPPPWPRSSQGSAPGCRTPARGSARSQGAGTCAARPPLKTRRSVTPCSRPVKSGPSSYPARLSLPRLKGTTGPATQDLCRCLTLLREPDHFSETSSGTQQAPSGRLTLVKVVTRRAAQVCDAWFADGFPLAGLGTNGPFSKIVFC